MDELPHEQIAHLREEDLGLQQFAVAVAFTILACVTVCLRIFTRMRLVHLVGLEDYFIVLSMVRRCFFLRTYSSFGSLMLVTGLLWPESYWSA